MPHLIPWQQYGSEYVYPDGPDEDAQDRYWRCRCGAFLSHKPTGQTQYTAYWACKRCGQGVEIDETPAKPYDYDDLPFLPTALIRDHTA